MFAAPSSNGPAPSSNGYRGTHHQYARSPKLKDRNSHPTISKDRNHNQAKRSSNKCCPPKSRKYPRENCVHRKTAEDKQKLEAKPWKHLEPVTFDSVPVSGEVQAGPCEPEVAGSGDWLSEELLQAVLAKDDTEELMSTDQLKTLWDEESVSAAGDKDAFLWAFDAGAGLTGAASAEGATGETLDLVSPDLAPEVMAKPVATDYELIEQSLASLKLCEDLPDDSQDSKLMPIFRENPFSYMISNSKCEASNALSAETFSCKHCEEAYEVVLDLESPSSKMPKSLWLCGFDLLRSVDSRLNFDWCKYNPPPWAMGDDDDVARADDSNSISSCGCDFCRSRIWSRVCRVCGTPLYTTET